MSLAEFNKRENGYYLLNHDSLILCKEVLSPFLESLIVPDSVKGNYIAEEFLSHQIDNIYYIFNRKKKLYKVNWFISYNHDSRDNEKLIKDITNLLGKPTSNKKGEGNKGDRIIWQQDSLSLSYNFNNENELQFVSLTNPFIPEDVEPIDIITKKYEKLIKADRKGIGDNTFSLTLNSLEKIVTNGVTLKKFENILPAWNTVTYYNRVGLANNKKTKIDDIPIFHFGYEFLLNKVWVTAIIEIEGDVNGKIKSIEVIYPVNGEGLAKFKKDLDLRGYYFDEILTQISYKFRENKNIYINRSKGTMVLITPKSYKYSFEISKK